MPEVKPNESREEYVARCIPEVMKEGKDRKAAVGKCEGLYDEHHKKKKSEVSCRYDTVMGYWLIEPDRLDNYVNVAWGVIERGELLAFKERSDAINEAQREQPYQVVDGLAKMTISGPMTKHPTSLTSLLGGTSTFQMREGLLKATHDPYVKGIFLEVDSGGGTTEGTAELAAAIRKADAVKPVFVHAPDCMASAALWAGSQGRYVTAGETALVGSLGTMLKLEDTSDRDKAMGRKPLIITTGKHKAMLTPPYTADKVAELERFVQQTNAVFWGDVSKARPKTKTHKDEILTARIFVGKDAMRVGLVDGICTTAEAFDYAKKVVNNDLPAGRGPGPIANPAAAPSNRSKVMPLTASQLTELRSLPGAAAATEDTADLLAFNAAMQLNRSNGEMSAKVRELESSITTLKASASKSAMDPELARVRCEAAIERLGIVLEKGKITSSQFNQIASAMLTKGTIKDGQLSTDAVANSAFFEKREDGKYVYQHLFAAFDDNQPNGILKDVSKDQPAPRTEPGAGDSKKGNQASADFGLEKHNLQRANAQLPALTRQQFDTVYPEYAGK